MAHASAPPSRIVLHGENTFASRTRVHELQNLFTTQKREVVLFDGRFLDLNQLIPTLESQSLFGQERGVIIDRLHKNKSPNKLKALIEYILAVPPSVNTSLVLWEDQLLTPAKLKKFSSFTIEVFKTSKSTFAFLDALGPSFLNWDLYSKSVSDDSPDYVFACLCNQVRSLLIACDNPSKVMPPWKQKQMVRQAERIGLPALLQLHHELVEIDYKRKSGQLVSEFETALQLTLIAWVEGLSRK
jgi:DNA polymerase III delta subunit